MKNNLVIATRKSPLALWQANWVKHELEQAYPDLIVTLLGLTTKADKMLETPLYKIGGKGLFVKELEEALFDKRADIAVHSIKDVPMSLPSGLCMPVICEREDPLDVFVSNDYQNLEDLPIGAKVGTSSLRRQSQLLALRSDLTMINLRGNVNTRLNKLDQKQFAAIILAAAGLKRLGLEDRVRSYLSIEQFLPAVGQGVLGIECREDDHDTRSIIAKLNDSATNNCVTAERAMCTRLDGGCQAPIASYAQIDQGNIILKALVAQPDGSLIIRAQQSAPPSEANALGIRVAEKLLQQGADEILRNLA